MRKIPRLQRRAITRTLLPERILHMLPRIPINILHSTLLSIDIHPVLQNSRSALARPGILRSAFDDVSFEEKMDTLQGHILRLRHAENGVDDHQDAARSEEEESAVRDIAQHNRRELRDHEIEQPLRHQRRRHDQTPDMIRRAFSGEHEWNGAPAEGIEDHEEVNADDGEDARAGERGARGDRVDGLINPDVVHGEGLAEAADHE